MKKTTSTVSTDYSLNSILSCRVAKPEPMKYLCKDYAEKQINAVNKKELQNV